MILFALLLAVPATRALAELKVGYVNAVRVIEEAPQGVAALKKLETEFSQRDKELVALQNRIRQIDEALQKNVPAQKETDRRTREREALTLKRELKQNLTSKQKQSWQLKPKQRLKLKPKY